MPSVFITGASGYIGGQALYSVSNAFPELSIRVLNRDPAKAKAIVAAFPDVHVVQGSLDDVALIAREAKCADIILHLADTNHFQSVQTIHNALLSKRESIPPVHWIQMSGGSLLASDELADPNNIPGSPSDLTFDDLDDALAIRSLIKKYPSRQVANFMLNIAALTPQVNTAITIGPLVYGQGQGPINQRSVQLPNLAKATLNRGRGLQIGEALNRWSIIHIGDLGELFVSLVEAALNGQPSDHVWNSDGIYVAGVGETSFTYLSHRIALVAANKNLIEENIVDEISPEEADRILPYATMLFGTNARGTCRRALEYLGWRASYDDDDFLADISRTVTVEARALGDVAAETDISAEKMHIQVKLGKADLPSF